MKRQFLGDDRDANKWAWLDALTRGLGYSTLQIVPMLVDDDTTGEGKTRPPVDSPFHDFCATLRQSRSLHDLHGLPNVLPDGQYQVELHKPDVTFTDGSRADYFSGIGAGSDQLLFVDPCTGFEPNGRTVKHVAFDDVHALLEQVTPGSVVTVYQHQQQRVPFAQTFDRIRRRFPDHNISEPTAYPVMFVSITATQAVDKLVRDIAAKYTNRGERAA